MKNGIWPSCGDADIVKAGEGRGGWSRGADVLGFHRFTANAIRRKTTTAQQLERTEKEMARLKGRLGEIFVPIPQTN